MPRLPLVLAPLAVALATTIFPLDARALPILSFEETAVVITGLPPGGRAAVLGVGKGRDGFLPFELAVWQEVTADATGTARLELELGVPVYSTWAAVELGVGELAVAAPAGTSLYEISFPLRGLPASLRSLEDARSALYVLWVRPEALGGAAAGAWGGGVRDGSGRDGDGAENRRLAVLLDLLEPLGASPAAPSRVAVGDVLIGVDPETLEIYTARLAG